MHFTSIVGHANLKMGVITSQPGEKEEDGNQHTDKNKTKKKNPQVIKQKSVGLIKLTVPRPSFLVVARLLF